MKKVAFHNLGCKVNAYETEAMIRQMLERGYELVPFEEKADIYVVNTCTVTAIADRKSRQMLHRAKKRNPDALVVAVGCYVQADGERAQADPAVDLIVGNDQKSRLADLIESRSSAILEIGASREYETLSLGETSSHTRVFLKIQDGCNQFCSYCLIPYVRGRVRSRQPDEVIAEAERMAAAGYREIVLTGIHVSSYGVDFGSGNPGEHLTELICRLAEIPGIARIRLSSLEPRIITEDFAQMLADTGKVCPHFHLSLQSGCNATLRRMNRKYTAEEYEERCQILRRVFDHPAITTDVIVGFPGETEEEFRETEAFLERIGFFEMHVFKYSPRKGTRAAQMSDPVPESVKAARSARLIAMSEWHSEEFRRWHQAHPREVLLEEKVTIDGKNYFSGHTREYVKEYVEAEGHQAGELVVITP